MLDSITNLIQLKGNDEFITKILPSDSSAMIVEVQLSPKPHFCPMCGFRMYSKGFYTRTVKHPILQDGRILILKLKQKKWKCQNENCNYFLTDQFSFVDKNRRVTNATDILIVQAFKDFNLSARQIAKTFHITDTYALNTFDRYVDMPRLKLPFALCIDEVNLSIPIKYKYALILQDFSTGEPVDMVISRRKEITEPYFANIPRVERYMVKYVISDMYAPYQKYVDTYFPNALPVVDSFHVIKLITQKLNNYLVRLKRKFKERDLSILAEKQAHTYKKLILRESKELYLLRTKRWIILANSDSINYRAKAYRDPHFAHSYMYVSDYENAFFEMDPNLKHLRDLKEIYVKFNKSYAGNPEGARLELEKVIDTYLKSGYAMFEEIAMALKDYKGAIINSFILIEKMDKNGIQIKTRLSNGPMESLNRVPKDMRRHARGYRNFNHIRNRFLYAERKNAAILAVPKPIAEVHLKTGVKRGPYKKKRIPRFCVDDI